jgi:hypothetical protein
VHTAPLRRQHPTPQERGHSRPVGVEHAGLWGIISFSWIGPLLRLGARGGIQENSASPFIPEADDAAVLARQFERKYAALQVRQRGVAQAPQDR